MLKIDLKKISCKIGGPALLLSAIFILLCSGCALKKPYVGMELDTGNWPKYSSGKKITFRADAAVFELTITKMQEDGEYILEGTMDGSNGSLKSINHLVIRDCRFSVILSKNNVVVDNISFFPFGDDHTHKLPFKKTFKSVPFDSIQITYQISVRG